MQLEITRTLVELLKNEQIGINAQLAVLPRDPTDEQPTVDMIVDGLSDEAAIKGEQFDRGVDILAIVAPDGPTSTRGGSAQTEASRGVTPMAVLVVHRGERTAAQRVQDCHYVMRAVVLCLQTAFWLRSGVTTKRNDVQVMGMTDLTYGIIQDAGNGTTSAVVFRIESLDKRAQAQRTVL